MSQSQIAMSNVKTIIMPPLLRFTPTQANAQVYTTWRFRPATCHNEITNAWKRTRRGWNSRFVQIRKKERKEKQEVRALLGIRHVLLGASTPPTHTS